MGVTKQSHRAIAKRLGITMSQLERLAENGIINLSGVEDNTEGSEAWGELSIADFARIYDLTVQRVNQLAEMGVVVKTQRGVCAAGESVHRLIAYRIEEHRRAAHRGRAPTGRDASYWAAKSRNLQLEGGATEAETAELARDTSTLLRAVFDMRATIEALPPPQGLLAEAGAKQAALEAAAGRLADRLARAMDAGFDHHQWWRRHLGVSAVSSE